MWLINSSIGRKLVMSISGMGLVLFLLFHGCMNVVLIFSESGYNWICSMLGASWYALIGTVGLAGLVLIHFCYAIILTVQNRMARGSDRYAVEVRQPDVEWESKNMLVLGIIVLGFLILHLYNFWFKMQFAELTGIQTGAFDPQDGASYVKALFTTPVSGQIYCALYLIWLCALWLHLHHGIWSALHTMGWNNDRWMPRLKVLAGILSSLVILPFAMVILYYFGCGIGLLL